MHAQIVVDESAMCTEPETLIPLVGFSPKIERIVLIGDHKQLQPIIKCQAAKKAQLDKSLFQRYAEKHSVQMIMLTEQYRMVGPLSHHCKQKLLANADGPHARRCLTPNQP